MSYSFDPNASKVHAPYCLPFGLEIARQLHDARKALDMNTILLRWDADGVAAPDSLWALQGLVEPWIDYGALRSGGAEHLSRQFFGRRALGETLFLPRRRSRLCPFHHAVCQPTRENAAHYRIALAWLREQFEENPSIRCPTFLVDLLDPWPRDIAVTHARNQRQGSIPAALRYYVFQRDGFRCVLCGASVHDTLPTTLHIGHKISRAHGGTDNKDNLLTLCAACNQGMGMEDCPSLSTITSIEEIYGIDHETTL